LGKIDFKEFVIKELKAKYSKVKTRKKWLSSLNANKSILGFENKVYDFGDHTAVPRVIPSFREGTPTNMVSMSVGFTQAEVEGCDKTIQAEIVATLQGMHVDENIFDFIMQTLATSVVGHRPRDKFQIWTGSGANGKGLTKTITAKAFGEYYYEPVQAIYSLISGSPILVSVTS
jgi:hypothetical protein